MRVLVDMDGVLADLEASFGEIWQARYPDRPLIAPEARTTFYLTDQYPREYRADIWRILTARGFFRRLPPVPGGIAALREMEQLGIEVFICSTPLTGHTSCMTEKYVWVQDHLGKAWTDRLILIHDKTLVRGDILIDDRPRIEGAEVPTWEHVLYDHPYNRAENAGRRLTWANWKAVLLPSPLSPLPQEEGNFKKNGV